jgi:hypothetical protein
MNPSREQFIGRKKLWRNQGDSVLFRPATGARTREGTTDGRYKGETVRLMARFSILAQLPDCELGPAGYFSFGGSRIFALPFQARILCGATKPPGKKQRAGQAHSPAIEPRLKYYAVSRTVSPYLP